ncbi:CocE/NonD family hydrolase [Leifsonia sp. Leaf264]|uniref:CocE/NonD family hydrolase n=1 Tax=Leifsonia sp. Leaf264 TaxID=1736314 RepID=UPI0009ECBE39|nr:CocE/NonD family hydrolase [Leifsonia sp. Leaf264]
MTTLRQRLTRALDARTRKGVELGPYDITIERDLRVPMDDGIELLADLIRPVGDDIPSLPTIVIRGPYGRRGPLAGSARALAYEGFTVLFQSCRGTWGSSGLFTPQIDEQRDGIATLRWVRKQPWFTGHLATYGQSYMGYTQWAVAGRMQLEDPENASEALVLITTMPDFGAITWDNGAFALRNALGWTRMMHRMRRGGLAMIGMALPDPKLEKAFAVLPLSAGDSAATGEEIHWYQDWTRHEHLSDEYWTQQSHAASVADVTAPVSMITGWYDIFLPWQLDDYAHLVEAGHSPRLILGPWGHTSPAMATPTHTETIAFLKETFAGASSSRPTPVRAFETGADEWHDLESWPPSGSAAQRWRLTSDGGLSTDAATGGVTSYTYDPTDATPAVGGPSLLPKTEPVDNREHEARPDLAVFRSAALDAPLEIAGQPVAHIRFRSSAPSYDVFVRITDVHPDGRSMTVCDGIRRIGAVGTVDTDPVPDADGFREVDVSLWPAFHRFAAGHSIGIQVSSGAHPRYARNPGSAEAAFDAAETQVAVQEISHDGADASRIELPVLGR